MFSFFFFDILLNINGDANDTIYLMFEFDLITETDGHKPAIVQFKKSFSINGKTVTKGVTTLYLS